MECDFCFSEEDVFECCNEECTILICISCAEITPAGVFCKKHGCQG
jgi:hypothetical protein